MFVAVVVVVVVGALVAAVVEVLFAVLLDLSEVAAPFAVFLDGFFVVESSRRQNTVAELRIADGGLVQGWVHD